MFYKNKRGLSDIIATVLIVLLAIAAIVIVWSFISRFLNTGGNTIDSQRKCLEVDVKPIGCSNSTKIVRIQVMRGSPTKAIALLTLSDDSIIVNKTNTIADGQLTIDVNMSYETKSAKSAKASAVILDQDGKEISCQESPITVECV